MRHSKFEHELSSILRFFSEIKFQNKIPFADKIAKEKGPPFPSLQFLFRLVPSQGGTAQRSGYPLDFFFGHVSLY